jgi:hypothetical protein
MKNLLGLPNSSLKKGKANWLEGKFIKATQTEIKGKFILKNLIRADWSDQCCKEQFPICLTGIPEEKEWQKEIQRNNG